MCALAHALLMSTCDTGMACGKCTVANAPPEMKRGRATEAMRKFANMNPAPGQCLWFVVRGLGLSVLAKANAGARTSLSLTRARSQRRQAEQKAHTYQDKDICAYGGQHMHIYLICAYGGHIIYVHMEAIYVHMEPYQDKDICAYGGQQPRALRPTPSLPPSNTMLATCPLRGRTVPHTPSHRALHPTPSTSTPRLRHATPNLTCAINREVAAEGFGLLNRVLGCPKPDLCNRVPRAYTLNSKPQA